MTRRKVLVVEDDAAIRRGLCDSLTFAGYAVLECADGNEGKRLAIAAELDLALLDVVLPGASGLEILTELRRSRPTLPVILVTARGAEEDRVRGLKQGADDYVVKPFSSSELVARVEAVLRRSAERPMDVHRLAEGGRTIDLARREVVLAGGERRLLSEREVDILRYLASSSGRAVTREELLTRVWRIDTRGLATRTIDMHIARLREKLGEDPDAARIVVTVRSKGYMLGDSVEIAAP